MSEAKPIGLVAPIKRKKNKLDLDGSLVDRLASDIQNVNRLDALESEPPKVRVGGNPTSPTKSTPSQRKRSQLDDDQASDYSDDDEDVLSTDSSDIDQTSDNSDEDENVSNDESDVNKQKDADAKSAIVSDQSEDHTQNMDQSVKVPKIYEPKSDLCSHLIVFLLSYIITIVVLILVSGTSTEQHNANQFMKKVNETIENQTNAYNWPEEMKQKKLEDGRIGREEIDKATKIIEIKTSIQGMTRINQFPKNLWDQFIPDLSRFEGVDEFLQKTETNGTKVEKYLYYTTPRFYVDKKIAHLQWNIAGTSKYVRRFLVEDCDMSANCRNVNWFIKSGDLHVEEKLVLKSKEYKFTRVYFIPLHKMI